MQFATYLSKNRWPLLAVLVGAAAALSGFIPRPQTDLAREPIAPAKAATSPANAATEPLTVGSWDPSIIPPMPSEQGEAIPGQTLTGEVLEQIDVDKYSYLRLGKKGSPGTWTAVPATTSQVGQAVTVSNAELMTHFVSATLKRTFETIYFGVLDSASEPSHANNGELADKLEQPHPGPGPGADSVAVGHVKRAAGALGSTVAELNAGSANAAGKKARVHAIVVKATNGVLGRTFLHLRDGSGEARTGTNDLAVTTTEEIAVGSDVVLEGTLELDKDFGSGYRYRVLLSDAMRVRD